MCLRDPSAAFAAARARHEAFDLSPAQSHTLLLDAQAAEVARGQGAIELALGELLVEMCKGDRFLEIGPTCLDDYADECMGMPPRLPRQWVRLAKELKSRPLLGDAVRKGVVSPRKALTVLPCALGRDEPLWTAAAMSSTVAELERAVRSERKEPPGDAHAMEILSMRLDGFEQDQLDRAIEVARRTLGPSAPAWQCLEAIAQEMVGALGAHLKGGEKRSGEEGREPRRPKRQTRRWKRKMRRRWRVVARHLAAVRMADWILTDEPPGGWDALALHAAIQTLLQRRKTFDAAFGTLALEIVRHRVWDHLQLGSFEDYCRNRLGMAPGTVRQRVWLERKLEWLPELREALAKGTISYSKALVVARHATPLDVDRRIAAAAKTSCRQTREKSDEEKKKRDRRRGVLEEWAPTQAAETWRLAVETVQKWWADTHNGERITPGWAVAIMARHFLRHYDVPEEPVSPDVKDRREVIFRTKGICAVPGCSRPARHCHHIVYRSHQGGDEKENLVGLCMGHHLRGVHLGYMTVRGVAGEHLVWHFKATGETWITRGAADVEVAARKEAGG